MNDLPNRKFDYTGNLINLCRKRKLGDREINRIFTELEHEFANNRFTFFIQASVTCENRTFLATGSGLTKKSAKNESAKNCLIKFLAYLRSGNPVLEPATYGLTEQDLEAHEEEYDQQATMDDSIDLSHVDLLSISDRLTIYEQMMNTSNYDKTRNPFNRFDSEDQIEL